MLCELCGLNQAVSKVTELNINICKACSDTMDKARQAVQVLQDRVIRDARIKELRDLIKIII